MKIEDLFERDIRRSINGVVKADQLDESSVWQELDEFVMTRELTRHFHDLVAVLLSTIQSEAHAADKNGIWISGFFGSGKSHLLKVLSYLLANGEHIHRGESRRAVDFFANKLEDAMLLGDLRKVVAASTETILFNIDSKADHRTGRDTLLQVFLRVLNEKQGYSGDHAHIAHMERHLEEQGRLEAFHDAFERARGESWLSQRDAWEFYRDEVIAALAEALQQSKASVEKWVDHGADNFTLTVENFARWVKRYLDSQGPEHRLMFLVDEVGQFIGGDTHLMLSLQTITEQLGTVCRGRAWVVVTSQEDLDSVLGEVNQARQHDFSKIQGRFKTRLSLSSANVDEVIKERLLRKNPTAAKPLAAAYEGKHDILRNQLSFAKAGTTLRTYADAADFAQCYPFAAYQFSLVQKVFESIRKAGATGLHLSQGERSTLDAFQSAAQKIGSHAIGALVPFYAFYPAVEGFLDTTVKRTIDRAADNHTLEAFDVTVLKVLFLIRYVEEIPGSVDNLVTLCVDEIDADKHALRKQVEASLERLEKETLIARNGDLYFFLTNEERDIGREIKQVTLPSGAEVRELGKLLFEDILGDMRKHSYSETGRDFPFTRICDDHAVGLKHEGSLEVFIASPLGDNYQQFATDGGCILATGIEQGRLLIRLPDDPLLGRELRAYLQTDQYVKTKHTGSLPETAKRILRDRNDDNRGRRRRILTILQTMLGRSAYFACSTRLELKSTDPKAALNEGLEYLIQNAYPKMGYIQHLHNNPKQEIQSLLRANDLDQARLDGTLPEANPLAIEDLREYVRLCAMRSHQITLSDLIEKRYGGRPYGWPELEVVLLVARLAVLKEINLLEISKSPIPLDQAYEPLTSSSKQRKVLITQRESAALELIKQAQSLGHELFAQKGAHTEEALFTFLRDKLAEWNAELGSFEPLAKTGKYPGQAQIAASQGLLRRFVEERDSLPFLKRFVGAKSELLKLSEDFRELSEFYNSQKHSWERLRAAVEELAQNRLQLEAHGDAGPALARLEEILASPEPYGQLHEAAVLIDTARKINTELIDAARSPVVLSIQRSIDLVKVELDKVSADDALRKRATEELQKLLLTATEDTSIAHIAQAVQQAEAAFDRSLSALEKAMAPPPAKPGTPTPATPPPVMKKRRVVLVKELCQDDFLETADDVTAFIGKLEATLRAAVDAGERVQIK